MVKEELWGKTKSQKILIGCEYIVHITYLINVPNLVRFTKKL